MKVHGKGIYLNIGSSNMLASGNNDVTSHPKTEYNPMGSICLSVDVLNVLETEHSSKIDFANHC